MSSRGFSLPETRKIGKYKNPKKPEARNQNQYFKLGIFDIFETFLSFWKHFSSVRPIPKESGSESVLPIPPRNRADYRFQ